MEQWIEQTLNDSIFGKRYGLHTMCLFHGRPFFSHLFWTFKTNSLDCLMNCAFGIRIWYFEQCRFLFMGITVILTHKHNDESNECGNGFFRTGTKRSTFPFIFFKSSPDFNRDKFSDIKINWSLLLLKKCIWGKRRGGVKDGNSRNHNFFSLAYPFASN